MSPEPRAFELRAGDLWALVEGSERPVLRADPPDGGISTLVQHEPPVHPWNEHADGGRVEVVAPQAVERFWKITAHCRLAGEGPFQVHGIMHGNSGYIVSGRLLSNTPGYMVFLEYEGDAPDRVSKLPGFESRGPFHPLGAGVGGKVMLADITDYTETETDFVLQPRSEEKS